ncbi:unnamed protein product, partial [Pocillopora meandrina]
LSSSPPFLHLRIALQNALLKNSGTLLRFLEFTVAVCKLPEGSYNLFDPHVRNKKGFSKGNGSASIKCDNKEAGVAPKNLLGKFNMTLTNEDLNRLQEGEELNNQGINTRLEKWFVTPLPGAIFWYISLVVRNSMNMDRAYPNRVAARAFERTETFIDFSSSKTPNTLEANAIASMLLPLTIIASDEWTSTWSTRYPPSAVLAHLQDLGFSVVAANTVGATTVWTLQGNPNVPR